MLQIGDSEDMDRYVELYWKRVAQSEGFDVNIRQPISFNGMIPHTFERYPCCGIAILYARLGLHRYNLLRGKNLQFQFVKYYNQSMGSAASCYCITLIAKDPATSEDLTFQAAVQEESYGKFDLTSNIARPEGTKEAIQSWDYGPLDDFYLGSLPDWPPENDFSDTKRFYIVNKSELQDNDWIRLCLELAVATTDRSTDTHDLSDLKILEVAIETKEDVEPPSERLNKKNAIIYIRYQGKPRACKPHVDCIAIGRRTLGEDRAYCKACLRLVGKIQSTESIPIKGKSQSLPLACRRRLDNHKRHAFKNHGLSLARHLKRQAFKHQF